MPGWLWGLLGTIGTAVLGVAAVRFANWLMDWNSRLVVKATVHRSFKKESLYEEIREWWQSKRTADDYRNEAFKDVQKSFDRLRTVLESEGYIRLELTNQSRKKLSGVTIISHLWGTLQINDGKMEEIRSETPVLLGDLQPKRTTVVHIVPLSVMSVDSVSGIRRAFSVSADELGRVAYKYPQAPHLADRRSNRVLMFFFLLSVFMTIGGIVAKPLAQLLGLQP